MADMHLNGIRMHHHKARIITGAVVAAMLFVLVSLLGKAQPAFASGGGAYAYVHTATSANIGGDYTLLDNPVTNNNPNAVVFITQIANSLQTYDNRNTGVWYDAWAGRWGIFNEDGSSMPAGASFNVYALPASSSEVFVQHVTSTSTLAGYITVIDNPNLNGNPSVTFQVSQNWNPVGAGGVYNDHAFGVWYDSWLGKWTIYNEDLTNLPLNASFNVMITTGVTATEIQTATASNTWNGATYINDTFMNNNPSALVFVTHVYVDGNNGPYMTLPTAVWYGASQNEWGITDITSAGKPIRQPVGDTFFVLGVPAN